MQPLTFNQSENSEYAHNPCFNSENVHNEGGHHDAHIEQVDELHQETNPVCKQTQDYFNDEEQKEGEIHIPE